MSANDNPLPPAARDLADELARDLCETIRAAVEDKGVPHYGAIGGLARVLVEMLAHEPDPAVRATVTRHVAGRIVTDVERIAARRAPPATTDPAAALRTAKPEGSA